MLALATISCCPIARAAAGKSFSCSWPSVELVGFTRMAITSDFGTNARATPPDVVAALNQEINAALADPSMQARIANFGYTTFASSPAEYGKLIAEDIEKWAKVIKFADIKPD